MGLPDTPEIRAKLAELAALERGQGDQRTPSLQKQRAAIRFDDFCEAVLKDEQTGEKIKLAEIHRQWIQHVRLAWSRGLHAVICAPMAHGKTAIFGVGLPSFMLGVNPALRVKIVSATNRPAEQRVRVVRTYIESEDYQALFPGIRVAAESRQQLYKLTLERATPMKDPSLEAVSISSPVLGARTDVMICDDVNDQRNTLEQPSLRELVWRNYKNTLISRLDDGGLILAICTRWSEHDLVGKILADETMRNYYAFLFQAISDDFTHIETEQIIGSGVATKPPVLDADDLFAQADAGLFDHAVADG